MPSHYKHKHRLSYSQINEIIVKWDYSSYKMLNIKNTKPSKSKKVPIFIGVVLVFISLVLTGSLYYYFAFGRQAAKSPDSSAEIKKQVASNKASASSDSAPEKNASSDTQAVVQPNTTKQLTSASVVISSFTQASGVINAAALVDGGSSSGTCYFIFSTEDEKPVTRSAQLDGDSCKISIPEVEFTKLGQWRLLISYIEKDSKTEASKYVTIN